MRGSKAAAEVAALEGLLSSPDTQECRRIFQESIGCEFDSQLAIDDCTSINKPQLALSRILQPPPNASPLAPEIEIFSCAQQTGLLTKAQATLHHNSLTPHLSGAVSRGTGHTNSELFNSQQGSRTEHIDVLQAQPSALYKSTEKAGVIYTHGIAVIARSRGGKMEDFISPLDGSDGSNLSPTQENDPAVYIRLQQELLTLPPDSQVSVQARTGATQEPIINTGSAPSAQDTGITFAVNDTGHITLDYQPPPSNPVHDSFDEYEVGEISSGRLRPQLFDGERLHPQTPAQAKLVIGHPGTVMRPSQMFAETQPSPGSRDRRLLLPSSSRPSPDLFNQYQSPKYLTSSPLARRLGKVQPDDGIDFDVSSSPESLHQEGDGTGKIGTRRPLSECADVLANARSESPIAANLMHQGYPEPFDVYTTRKESQERRRQQVNGFDDVDQSSDDGFSDDEAELNRRAKRRKDEAARELAVLTSSRPGSVGKEFVEVPSTNTGRRRSLAEEYEAQCSGLDARDTQPDATILDSQSAPAGATVASVVEATRMRKDGESVQSDPQTSQYQNYSQEFSSHSERAVEESPEQLPALERNENSQATESERESLGSPLSQHITSQVPSNMAELRTPAMHRKLHYVDGDTIVPETSPSEPHLQRYGDIVSQTPPVKSAEEVDDAFNPFTQDTEFNNLIHSPSPRRMRPLQAVQLTAAKSDTYMKLDLGAIQGSKETETSDTNANPSTTEQHENVAAMSLAPRDTASEDVSEYVTAPTGFTFESHTPKAQSNLRADSINTSVQGQGGEGLPEDIVQDFHIGPAHAALVGSNVTVSEIKQQIISADTMEDLPCSLTPLTQKSARDLGRDGNKGDLGDTERITELGHPEPRPAKKTRLSSRPSKQKVKLSKTSIGNTTDITPVNLSVEPSEVLPNRLRSATQLRGSSRALRRLLEDNVVASGTSTTTKTTPTPAVQKVTRSSRRSSANSSEKAQSTEPEAYVTPTLSTRRRTMSNQPIEPGLFDGMAFSITYSANREDEKQQVLSLIRKNGGRVLEKGFDELFDMSALQTSTVARSNEGGSIHDGSTLTLTAAARGVGFACVITDEHSRRVKFMQALALGLPCLSGRWVEHCVAKKEILDWEQYHLAAGESSFLGGAIRSRNLPSYPAITANFVNRFESRPKLLTGKSILIITGKGRVEERRKPYFFLTQALGACRVKHVPNNQEARKTLLEAETNGEEWNWVYVDENEDEAEKAIFGASVVPQRKRKRGSEASEDSDNTAPAPKKVRIVSDEYVIQSLILGKFLEE